MASSYVQVTEKDVLCGRDKLAYSHPGNKFFRSLVQECSVMYQQATYRRMKTEIIQTIISKVQESGGRFLKLEDDLSGLINWNEMDSLSIHQKVAHALRSSQPTKEGSKRSLSSSLSNSSIGRIESPQSLSLAQPLPAQPRQVTLPFQHEAAMGAVPPPPPLISAESEQFLREFAHHRVSILGTAVLELHKEATLYCDHCDANDEDSNSVSSSESTSSCCTTTSDLTSTSTSGHRRRLLHQNVAVPPLYLLDQVEENDLIVADEDLHVLLQDAIAEDDNSTVSSFYTLDGQRAQF